jgi:hypothetical protein
MNSKPDWWVVDWLIIYCFTYRSRIFHSYGDVTITGEGLKNLGLCLALRAFEQGGIFIVRNCCTRDLGFSGRIWRMLSPPTTHKGMWRTYSNPDPQGSPFSRLLRHARGCWGSILARIPTGILTSCNSYTRMESTSMCYIFFLLTLQPVKYMYYIYTDL